MFQEFNQKEYLTKYDVCSICRDMKFFIPLGAKWCKQSKHDCGMCDMEFTKKSEIEYAIEYNC